MLRRISFLYSRLPVYLCHTTIFCAFLLSFCFFNLIHKYLFIFFSRPKRCLPFYWWIWHDKDTRLNISAGNYPGSKAILKVRLLKTLSFARELHLLVFGCDVNKLIASTSSNDIIAKQRWRSRVQMEDGTGFNYSFVRLSSIIFYPNDVIYIIVIILKCNQCNHNLKPPSSKI